MDIHFSSASTALYVGAAQDILPMMAFPCIKKWFCIDGLPFHEKCNYTHPNPKPSMKRQLGWIHHLIAVYKHAGFDTDFIDADFKRNKQLVFKHQTTNQVVVYLYNVVVDPICPLDDHVRQQIGLCDTLVYSCCSLYQHLLGNLQTDFNFITNAQIHFLSNDKFDMFHGLMYDHHVKHMKSVWRIKYTNENEDEDHVSDMLSYNCGHEYFDQVFAFIASMKEQNTFVKRFDSYEDLFKDFTF